MVNYIIIVSAVQREISSQEVHWKYICFERLTFHTGYLPGAEESGLRSTQGNPFTSFAAHLTPP